MGGKHLKKLRAERAKIHLKKKKEERKLPKGQNITDTTFKTKKIVTYEQLRKVDENEPVSSWNLTLKDLTNRLTHYNYTTRLNSLTGIKELIVNYPSILEGPSLRTIITRVLELLIDVEHRIRVTAISLLSDLFSRLPPHFLLPFHDLCNVHLGCSMTHREQSIQQDSLRFLEVMVQYMPKAIEKNFSLLVQNFIRIISSHKHGQHSDFKNFTKNNNKQDLEKAKLEMLRKFYQLLNTVYSKWKKNNIEQEDYIEILSEKSRFDLRTLNDTHTKIPDLSSLFKVSQNESDIKNGFDEFQNQVSAIVTVLFNSWSESAPNQSSDEFASECLLSESIAQLLLIILQIFLLLYEKTLSFQNQQMESWFISSHGPAFSNAFLVNFPYLPSVSVTKPASIIDQESTRVKTTTYMSQNLILCYLYYQLKVGNKIQEIATKVNSFLLDALRIKNPSDFKTLVKVIEVKFDISKPSNLEEFITYVVKVHDATSNSEYRRRLFSILTKIVGSERHGCLRQNTYFKKWLKSLPEKLLGPEVPLYVVEALLRVVNQATGKEILDDLEGKALIIAAQLPNIRVIEKDEFEGQKMIGNILYRCQDDVLAKIVNILELNNESYPSKLRNYLLDIIDFKLSRRKYQRV